MATAKKAPSAPRPFAPGKNHKISIGEAHQIISSSTFTVYGRLISGVTIEPAQAGLTHPRGENEELQLALIFGTQDNGDCARVNPPQKVYMPTPDGPADGCGWDPKQYVVWKNLPKDWTTLHVQSQPKTLAMALAPKDDADEGPQFLADVLCIDWMQLAASQFIDPSSNLQAVWVTLHQGDFTFNQQASLSNVIQKAYGKTIAAASLTATTTVQTLASWIPAAINS